MAGAPSLPYVKVVAPDQVSGADVNITAQVLVEFDESGILAVVPIESFRLEMTSPASAGAVEPMPLDPGQVKRLRDADDDWQLFIKAGDQTCVVTRTMLRDLDPTLNPDVNSPEVVRAKPASSADELLTTSVAKLLGPESSWERIQGGLSLPVTQAALIGSAAGVFGLGALKDKAVRPGLLALAVLLALVCIVLSLVSANRLGTVIFKPSRLDLLRGQYNRAMSAGVKASNRGLVLLVLAVVAATFAFWPSDDAETEEIQSTLSWSASKGADESALKLHIAWAGLSDDVARVVATASAGSTQLAHSESPRAKDGSASADLQATASSGKVTITSRFLDKSGAEAEKAEVSEIEVP